MWHEARKQEKRIRGMIVDYRKRAERRQDFYEKIQADPTQFIQVHGRRCKIHLDSQNSGDGTGIIVPWQGQEDNLIDRFDVRAHLDIIPTKKDDNEEELSFEERQCNYERYRILAQNDFLNVTEDKFLHQLCLEEQYGVNAQMEQASERAGGKKKQAKATGATIGYSYEDTDSTSGPQPFSHLMQASHMINKPEKESDSESDSDIDMDVSIEVSKLDTNQAHELNSCGRNYGMLSNDFYSYLTKDADEADALRLAREQEHEKMLLAGRKSRRERRLQKERRIACRPFSPPSYAAKVDAAAAKKEKEEESSRSPSPNEEGNTEKITYITSFGGEEELQPHSKISINLPKVTHTLGESCVGASISIKKANLAQRSKEGTLKMLKTSESSRTRRLTRSRSSSRKRSRTRSRSRTRLRRRSNSPRSRSRSGSNDNRHADQHRTQRKRRYHSRRSQSSTSSSSLSSSSSVRKHQRNSASPLDSNRDPHHKQRKFRSCNTRRHSRSSRSSSPTTLAKRSKKITPPVTVEKVKPTLIPTTTADSSITATVPMISYPLQTRIITPGASAKTLAKKSSIISTLSTLTQVEEPPPPPLKRYYGRKRGEESSSDSKDSDTDVRNVKGGSIDEQNNDTMDMDTTSERSNPLPSTSTAIFGKQTGKYSTAQAKNPSLTNASETKASTSSGAQLNLRERLKRKMQNLLNKQYKRDKRAEIEKTERERQIQQEREDEMRELALKLRRRQRELRHKYGTPSSSKCSDSDASEGTGKPYKTKARTKSRSIGPGLTEKRQKTPRRSRERDHEREEHEKERKRRSHTRSRSRSAVRARSRRSSSRRRRRSPSTGRARRQRSSSYDRSSRFGSEHSRQSYRQLDRRQNEHERERNRDRERNRERDRDREWERNRERDKDKIRDRDRERDRDRDRDKDKERERDRSNRERQREVTTSSSSENNRNRVVISAPPKLKKLVDY